LSQISSFAVWFFWLLQSASQESIPLLGTALNHIMHEFEHNFLTAITFLSISIDKHECTYENNSSNSFYIFRHNLCFIFHKILHDFIFSYLNNMFFINCALKLKYTQWLAEGSLKYIAILRKIIVQ
jgi:hypothetical protein